MLYTILVCVYTEGRLWACGSSECGQLGTAKTSRAEVPIRIYLDDKDTTTTIESIVVGYAHVIAYTTNNEIYTWGLNTHGQLGIGHLKSTPKPEKIKGIATDTYISHIYADGNSSAYLTNKGLLYTWGDNRYNRLLQISGYGTKLAYTIPTLASLVHKESYGLRSLTIHSFVFGSRGSAVYAASTIHEVCTLLPYTHKIHPSYIYIHVTDRALLWSPFRHDRSGPQRVRPIRYR